MTTPSIQDFNAVRDLVIEALRNGLIAHEPRLRSRTSDPNKSNERNYLLEGTINVSYVITLLEACRQGFYHSEPHRDRRIPCNVHIFLPMHQNVRWYIKVYFLADLPADPDLPPLESGPQAVMFISVHPSDHDGP